METDISSLFTTYKTYLDKDRKMREEIDTVVKNLDQAVREIVTALQAMHNTGVSAKISTICSRCREIIDKNVKCEFMRLSQILASNSQNEYYKYHENWREVTRRLSFAVGLITFLETGELVLHEDVAKALAINCNREQGFHLDLEDYLMGLLQLSSELSRFAVNSVAYGDYERPLQISRFVSQLNAGFQLMNFKNDSLRRNFDGLKYDIKKIEEVVYDLSIRGLKGNVAYQA